MRAYTNLEQSRKLADFLPSETADMSYRAYREEGGIPDYQVTLCPHQFASWVGVPCWSLVALFDILPLKIEDEYSVYDLKIDMVDKMPRYVQYGDCYHDSFPWDFEKEDLLDNVVESIIWLHNNHLSK